jgi:hypothetical protein
MRIAECGGIRELGARAKRGGTCRILLGENAGVGRVSPRPPGRGLNCTLSGRELLREARRTSAVNSPLPYADADGQLPDMSDRAPEMNGRSTIA